VSSTTTLAGWELRTAVRSRWVLAAAGVFAVLCGAVALLGLRSLRALGLAGAGATAEGLVNLGVVLPPLIGLLLGAAALAGARERGLLALLAAQPVSRLALVAGAFLGATGALWALLGLAYGATGLVLAGVAVTGDLPAFGGLVVATLAATAAAAAVGVGISALSSNRLQATAAAVTLWFVFAFGLDLLTAALVPGLRLGPAGLLTAVLANPLESARLLALLVASPDGAALGPFGSYLTGRFGAVGASGVLAGGLAAWIIVPLGVAWAALQRRDV
jgi:Cu-processing system permease protein